MIDRAHLEAERALNLLRLAARVDPILRQAVADVEATLDAERERAEGYQKALEKEKCRCFKMPVLKCPECSADLVSVPRDSMLNPDQWDAVKAGDYYCSGECRSDKARSGKLYFRREQLTTYVQGETCSRCATLEETR